MAYAPYLLSGFQSALPTFSMDNRVTVQTKVGAQGLESEVSGSLHKIMLIVSVVLIFDLHE